MSFIYLGAPYTDPDPAVMRSRYRSVEQVHDVWTAAGHTVYSPVLHYKPTAERLELDHSYAQWKPQCLDMLEAARVLAVITLDGWLDSIGLKDEGRFANKNKIPVEFYIFRDCIVHGAGPLHLRDKAT